MSGATMTMVSNVVSASRVPPIVQYLVIAGGGSGGLQQNRGAGGGGAGGYRTSYGQSGGGANAESAFTFAVSTNYTVTVGAGGASHTTARNGNKGSNSVFNTITSEGGGAGGGYTEAGGDSKNGGSGGGSSGYGTAQSVLVGTGTANQGFAGGLGVESYGPDPTGLGGGGGGAGAVGGAATGTTAGVGGNGGAGVASSITGSSVFRAGGGGGAVLNNGSGGQTAGVGGNGGGGYGGRDGAVSSGFAGDVNTGSGGGGGNINSSGTSGAGGSGIVILRYPSAFAITIGAGLTGSTATDGAFKFTTITAGTGNVSWT